MRPLCNQKGPFPFCLTPLQLFLHILKNYQQKYILSLNNISRYKNVFCGIYQLFSIKIFSLSLLYLKLYEKLYKNTSLCGIFHSATCFSCQKWYTNIAMGSVDFPFLSRLLRQRKGEEAAFPSNRSLIFLL